MEKAIVINSSSEVEKIRISCQKASDTLSYLAKLLKAGITTLELDKLAYSYITDVHGSYPSPLNYRGFPNSICTSVNNVICHGIPNNYALKDGDIINLDITTYFPINDGYHGDTSATFYIGQPSEKAIKVVEIARKCLNIGISQVKDGARVGDIGAAIQETAEKENCSVVQDYSGHGIGKKFHCEPKIPHFGVKGLGKRLKSGMVFTIEPMINLGTYISKVAPDGWTVITADNELSAQFEHTLVVTKEGCEILTERNAILENSEDRPWSITC